MDSVSKSRPFVVHPDELVAKRTIPDMAMRHRFDPDGRWVGWTGWITNEAGDVSGWHHHAANDTYVYVIRGSVTIEFGSGGAERIDARAGDFIVVPARTVHRETTSADGDLDAFLIRVGTEPEYVDLGGPEPAT